MIDIFKKENLVGLDIGSSSMKIAHFTDTKEGLRLTRAELREYKRSADGQVTDDEMLASLKAILGDINLKKTRFIVNIDSAETAIKKITAPYMPRKELTDGVKLEADNYFPFSTAGSILDFEITGDVVEKGVKKYDLIVGVSPRKTVEKYLAILGKAGIRPSSVIPSSYALWRTALRQPTEKGAAAVCSMDIGELYNQLIITKGRDLVFARKLPISGNDLKKNMDESLDLLIKEIERCLSYFREISRDGKVDTLILYGGGACFEGITGPLSEGLGMEVKFGDPLSGINTEKDAVREKEKVSYRLGAAIAAALSDVKGINLLPLEIKEEVKRVFKRGTMEAAATAALIASILFYIGMETKADNLSKRVAAAKQEVSSLSRAAKLAEAKRLAQTVLSDEPYWEDIFYELGGLVNSRIVLDSVSMDNKVITITGTVDSPEGQQILADFMIRMEKGIFNSVKLIESRNILETPGVEFTISCQVDYEK